MRSYVHKDFNLTKPIGAFKLKRLINKKNFQNFYCFFFLISIFLFCFVFLCYVGYISCVALPVWYLPWKELQTREREKDREINGVKALWMKWRSLIVLLSALVTCSNINRSLQNEWPGCAELHSAVELPNCRGAGPVIAQFVIFLDFVIG